MKNNKLIILLILTFVKRLFLNFSFSQCEFQKTNGPFGGTIKCTATSGTNIFIGTNGGGVYLSNNNGALWVPVNNGLTTLFINAIAITGSNIFVGTPNGAFLSTNNGNSWTQINTGFSPNTAVTSLAASGTTVIAGSMGAVYKTFNNGTLWTLANVGIPTQNVTSLAMSGVFWLAGIRNGSGMYQSINNGSSWTQINNGLPAVNKNITSIIINAGVVRIGTEYNGVFASTLPVTSWNPGNAGLTNLNVNALAVSGSTYFAGTTNGVFTGSGGSWTAMNNGLTDTYIISFAVNGTNVFAGGQYGGIFLSVNNGNTWTSASNGINYSTIYSLAVSGSNLFAGTKGLGVLLSTNNGVSWTPVNTGLPANIYVFQIKIAGSNLFAATDVGVFLSNNNGTTWTAVNTGLTNTYATSLAVIGTNIFAGTSGGGVFLSNNNGASWTAINTGLTNTSVRALTVNGSTIFAGTAAGVFLSTNNGITWSIANTGLPPNPNITSLETHGTNIFVGPFGAGAYMSSNNGSSWTSVNNGLPPFTIYSFVSDGPNIYAGGANVYLSSNNGTSWSTVNNPGIFTSLVYAVAKTNTTIFAGTFGFGLWSRDLVFSTTFTNSNVTCNGGSNGTAGFTITGNGTAPFTYTWMPSNQATQNASGLSAGVHMVTATDANGCTVSQTIAIAEPPAMTLLFNNTNASCFGSSDGSSGISVPSNGTPPYTYLWSTGSTQSNISGLIAGIYTVTVTDANGCNKSQSTTITQPTALSASVFITPVSKCSGSCDGIAILNTSGGTPPFTFQWDALAGNQTSATAGSLCPGTYSVVITDSKACVLNKQVALNQVAASTYDPQAHLTNIAAVDLINVSPSFAAYYVYDLPASITPNVSNPRNFVDAGKYARFKIQAENKKSNGQSIVSGSCKVRTNSIYANLTDSASALNNIGWNTLAWSADEFEVYIKPNTPPGSNIYVDFVVQENTNSYITTCIAIPVMPLVYSPTTAVTIDDDSNPDSQGNNNDLCEPGETIEFYPWMNNISTFNAEYVRGSFENLDNLAYINIWNNVAGVSGTVYQSSWWNYSFSLPTPISVGQTNMTPQFDFVFDYNNSVSVSDFKLYMVMAGGFKLFGGNALSLVQWTLPFTFNSTLVGISEENDTERKINIYPNPFSEIATIEIRNGRNHTIDETMIIIFDITGKELAKWEISDFESKLYRNNLSNGIYMYRVENKEELLQLEN